MIIGQMKTNLTTQAVVIVVIVGVIMALIYTSIEGGFGGGSRDISEDYGRYECIKESGLPGGATGKMFYFLGKNSDGIGDPNGQYYGPGDSMYVGYCGPDGRAIR